MSTLAEMLMAPQRRHAIIADCVRRLEAHVAAARGIKGAGLRAGLAALKKARPDALPRATARLLPEFAEALEPLYREFQSSGEASFATFLEPRRQQAREMLLAVTDARAAATSHRALAAAYRRLRGTLAAELDDILPDLIRALGKQIR